MPEHDTTTQLRALDLPVLTRYFAEHDVDVSGDLRAELISGGRSNLTFLISDDKSRWVLRRPPVAGLTPSAHDVAREFRVTAALQDTDVPVARTVVLCEDDSVMGAPFAVVEHVDGHILRRSVDLDPFSDTEVDGCVTELIRVLAALHAVDHRAVGLEKFGRESGYVGRQVKLWTSQWERVKFTEIPDVERLGSALAATIPDRDVTAIVHGDYRIDNTILSPTDITKVDAVLDWELSTLGDPLADAALMCIYRDPAFSLVLGEEAAWSCERIPSADELAQRYTLASGRDLEHWDFFCALANFKLAVVAAGIYHRHLAGATEGDEFARAADAVPVLAAAGLTALAGKS
ncbi:MAG TPA: phosphotransferase family protein [Aldersonia sp.]